MSVDSKKSKEQAIFNLVYAGRPIESVIPSEEPDFRVKNADGEFGVEITEFYFTHSQARLRNIPSYGIEILDTKKYRHKDDIVPLEVKEFTIIPNDGSPSFTVEGLIQQVLPMPEYVAKISELIEDKNKLFSKYSAGLHHVNLIIRDYEHRLIGVPRDRFHYLLFQPALEKARKHADFREVYLVTELGEYASCKDVYIPLKMVFLVVEIFLLIDILVKEYPEKLVPPQLFAEYLIWWGVKNVSVKDDIDSFEIVYGNAGIVLAKGAGTKIKDYSDLAVPEDFTPVSASEVSSFFDSTFQSKFEKQKRESLFTSPLCFDVNGSTQADVNK